jgi:3-methyladenine DNA glycosylase AlkC
VAEPFKNLLDAALVRRLATRLQGLTPAFDARRFVALASADLAALELKARALQICAALEATLPAEFEAAAALLRPAMQGDDSLGGWVLWPVGEFIARRGQSHPELALALLHTLTQRFSAEFAIRPFIVKHPALAFRTLTLWARDPSEDVRRLVSEGSRPRLPWGMRLQALVADPSPTLPLLRLLQDDPSAYVRRSVANHLNDIAKDHPALVAGWLEEHLPGAPPARRALLRHASRTLIKQGDRRVLAAWGLGRRLRGHARLKVEPAQVDLGHHVTLKLVLASSAARAQALLVDYAVHHVKADSRLSPKVFKGWRVELPPHGMVTLEKRHSMRAVTTRRYHAGRHRLSVLVNGETVAEGEFTLRLPAPEPGPAG